MTKASILAIAAAAALLTGCVVAPYGPAPAVGVGVGVYVPPLGPVYAYPRPYGYYGYPGYGGQGYYGYPGYGGRGYYGHPRYGAQGYYRPYR